jgi:hypothetical protein
MDDLNRPSNGPFVTEVSPSCIQVRFLEREIRSVYTIGRFQDASKSKDLTFSKR